MAAAILFISQGPDIQRAVNIYCESVYGIIVRTYCIRYLVDDMSEPVASSFLPFDEMSCILSHVHYTISHHIGTSRHSFDEPAYYSLADNISFRHYIILLVMPSRYLSSFWCLHFWYIIAQSIFEHWLASSCSASNFFLSWCLPSISSNAN